MAMETDDVGVLKEMKHITGLPCIHTRVSLCFRCCGTPIAHHITPVSPPPPLSLAPIKS